MAKTIPETSIKSLEQKELEIIVIFSGTDIVQISGDGNFFI